MSTRINILLIIGAIVVIAATFQPYTVSSSRTYKQLSRDSSGISNPMDFSVSIHKESMMRKNGPGPFVIGLGAGVIIFALWRKRVPVIIFLSLTLLLSVLLLGGTLSEMEALRQRPGLGMYMLAGGNFLMLLSLPIYRRAFFKAAGPLESKPEEIPEESVTDQAHQHEDKSR